MDDPLDVVIRVMLGMAIVGLVGLLAHILWTLPWLGPLLPFIALAVWKLGGKGMEKLNG